MYYVISMVILTITLFWALWDEDFGQRPWKAYQREWKERYVAVLDKVEPKSEAAQKSVESSSDYVALQRVYQRAEDESKAPSAQTRTQLADANGKLLAIRSVFTDRRAYVNALTYDIETETSDSSKQSLRNKLAAYKNESATVEFPDGTKKKYTFKELEEAFNEANAEKTRLSLQLGRNSSLSPRPTPTCWIT